jgi:hypothetical protein
MKDAISVWLFVYLGSRTLIKFLLGKGLTPDALSKRQFTALQLAAYRVSPYTMLQLAAYRVSPYTMLQLAAYRVSPYTMLQLAAYRVSPYTVLQLAAYRVSLWFSERAKVVYACCQIPFTLSMRYSSNKQNYRVFKVNFQYTVGSIQSKFSVISSLQSVGNKVNSQ